MVDRRSRFPSQADTGQNLGLADLRPKGIVQEGAIVTLYELARPALTMFRDGGQTRDNEPRTFTITGSELLPREVEPIKIEIDEEKLDQALAEVRSQPRIGGIITFPGIDLAPSTSSPKT